MNSSNHLKLNIYFKYLVCRIVDKKTCILITIENLIKERNKLNARIQKAEQEYTDQLQGRAGQAGAGNGPLSKALKDQLDALVVNLARFDQQNAVKINEFR